MPLGRRESAGLVVGLARELPALPSGVVLRSLGAVLDSQPVLPSELLAPLPMDFKILLPSAGRSAADGAASGHR